MVTTEHTPNPDTLKFLPGKKVSEIGPVEYLKNNKNIDISLANKILSLKGTLMVFFGEDFITVKKEKDLNWEDLKHGIISEINEYYSQGHNVVIEKKSSKSNPKLSENETSETVKKIIEVLDTRVRPAVAMDGGDIIYDSFKDGIVYLHMQGACSGCPSSTATLKMGIENMLKHYIPEVQEVRPTDA